MNRRIEAVLFDFFGTLVPNFDANEFQAMMDKFAVQLGVEADALRQAWRECYTLRATGVHQTLQETLELMIPPLGGHFTPELAQAINVSRTETVLELMKYPFDGVAETLDKLEARGLRYALVSDCSTEVPALWPQCPLAGRFEVTVFSSEIGHRKPAPEMYLTACERLKIEPSACVFLGDGGSHELRGAENVGITPILAAYEPDSVRYDADRECDRRIDDIRELPEMIRGL